MRKRGPRRRADPPDGEGRFPADEGIGVLQVVDERGDGWSADLAQGLGGEPAQDDVRSAHRLGERGNRLGGILAHVAQRLSRAGGRARIEILEPAAKRGERGLRLNSEPAHGPDRVPPHVFVRMSQHAAEGGKGSGAHLPHGLSRGLAHFRIVVSEQTDERGKRIARQRSEPAQVFRRADPFRGSAAAEGPDQARKWIVGGSRHGVCVPASCHGCFRRANAATLVHDPPTATSPAPF